MHTSSLFISWPLGQSQAVAGRYADAVVRDMKANASNFKKPIVSLYLAADKANYDSLKWLLDTSGTLLKTVSFAKNAECTLEIGPAGIDEQLIVAIKQVGINRIVLRYDKDTLVHRDCLEHAIRLMSTHISNIAIDLYAHSKATLNRLLILPIVHISLYTMHQFCTAKDTIEAAGFIAYEWQHFAKPGFESVHAMQLWDRKPYCGIGAGACSFDGKRRRKNSNDIEAYCDANIPEYQELLCPQQIKSEIIMTALRKPQGVCKKDLSPSIKQKMSSLIDQGLLCDHGTTIGYTDRGFLLENQILTQII